MDQEKRSPGIARRALQRSGGETGESIAATALRG